jgi:hypothetical protein
LLAEAAAWVGEAEVTEPQLLTKTPFLAEPPLPHTGHVSDNLIDETLPRKYRPVQLDKPEDEMMATSNTKKKPTIYARETVK